MSGRGVTEDSPWFTSGQGFNRAHLIANEFGGSGYAEGANLATTSAYYNQTVMRDAERLIGASIVNFAEARGLEPGSVTFDLTVTVRFGELRDAAMIAKIKQQPWFSKEAGGDLDAEIVAKIDDDVVHPKLLRVIGVTYTWASVDPAGLTGVTSIPEDLWLLVTEG
jgi:hypothetical protein